MDEFEKEYVSMYNNAKLAMNVVKCLPYAAKFVEGLHSPWLSDKFEFTHQYNRPCIALST